MASLLHSPDLKVPDNIVDDEHRSSSSTDSMKSAVGEPKTRIEKIVDTAEVASVDVEGEASVNVGGETPVDADVSVVVGGGASVEVSPVNVGDCVSVQGFVAEGSSKTELVQKSSVFSPPSLGAWAKPLKVPPSSPSTLLVLQETGSNLLHDLASYTHWPSLSAGNQHPSSKHLNRESQNRASNVSARATNKLPVKNCYPPAVKEDGNLRFPWAAKLNPSMRNLYKSTSPSFLEDGTPKVTIPSKLLLHGPENQKEYIIGQFYRCSAPSGGLIHAVVNRIWGRKCRIFTRKLGESSYLFHIPDESTRSWILQRGLWHVDDCLMFVATWSPAATLALPEISTAPVWVTLKNIPSRLYSIPGICRIASALGEPIITNKPRLDPTLMGEAKILVEVELDKPFYQKIALDDKKGNISIVNVEYSWIPTKCGKCGLLGHKDSRCLQHNVANASESALVSSSESTSISGPGIAAAIVPTVSTNPTLAVNATEQVPFVAIVPTISTTPVILVIEQVHPPTATTTTVDNGSLNVSATIDSVSTTIDHVSASTDFHCESLTNSQAHASTSLALEILTGSPIANDTKPTTPSNEATLNENMSTSLVSTGIVPISTVMADTHAAIPAIESDFLSPIASAPNDVYRFGGMLFPPFNGDCSGYENEFETAQRSRGGRPLKPSQKVQDMHWITVGRNNRGRGGRGGRGHHR